ncbi:MAG TPA: FxsA family protein [Candidatus Desulfofervidus auxilii]|uniref:FxsA family protein n=1 Tax=Desulfofervidus auxilii TaxID=1621989 RepID=A0A7C0U392_DESA2|nr:FxsA family protein [Candidatus Desulfofervidus auxilii]
MIFLKLFILFTLVTILELALIIEVGSRIGIMYTILLIIGTAILGAYLAQSQGLAILMRIQNELKAGILPNDTLIEGLLILIGGVLLLTPGFVTDTLGFLCILPPSRKRFREKLKAYFRNRIYWEIYYGG